MKKKAAVLLATYNGEQYIWEQLESVRLQTRAVDYVLIGDDGSSDNTVQLIQDFIRDNCLEENWKLYLNPQNLGHAANFIHLCQLSSDADYIFFCDQDDIWKHDKIEKMLNCFQENPEIKMLSGEPFNFRGDLVPNEATSRSGRLQKVPFNSYSYFHGCLGCCSCLESNFMQTVLQYWCDGWEHDMFFRACALLIGGGYSYDETVVYRRMHDGNASMGKRRTRQKRLLQVRQSVERPRQMKRLLGDQGLSDAEAGPFLDKYEKSLKLRVKMLERHNPFYAVLLAIKYKDCYLHGVKGCVLDAVLSICSEVRF